MWIHHFQVHRVLGDHRMCKCCLKSVEMQRQLWKHLQCNRRQRMLNAASFNIHEVSNRYDLTSYNNTKWQHLIHCSFRCHKERICSVRFWNLGGKLNEIWIIPDASRWPNLVTRIEIWGKLRFPKRTQCEIVGRVSEVQFLGSERKSIKSGSSQGFTVTKSGSMAWDVWETLFFPSIYVMKQW